MVNDKVYGAKDARSVGAHTQEAIRLLAVAAVDGGVKQSDAAKLFGVSLRALSKWMKLYREGGPEALKAKPRGRPRGGKLDRSQYEVILALMRDYTPDQLGLPFYLWSREAVRQLLKRQYGISYSLFHVGRYLRTGGLDQEKPMRRALAKNPVETKAWMEQEYPLIRARAREQGAEIQSCERSTIKSGSLYHDFFSPTGHDIISANTNQGTLRFMIYKRPLSDDIIIRFLENLIRDVGRKIILIVDGHPVHDTSAVRAFTYEHIDEIELYRMSLTRRP